MMTERFFFFQDDTMRDHVSRQVQTEMTKKDGQKEAPILKRPEKRPETKKCAGRARRHASREAGRASEAFTFSEPHDSRKLTQTMHEKNQAELPMRLGVNSRESGRSRTKSLSQACENPVTCRCELVRNAGGETPEHFRRQVKNFFSKNLTYTF